MAREPTLTLDEAVARIMEGLKCGRAEAEEVYKYDKAIDAASANERLEYDLTPQQEKVARTFSKSATRKRSHAETGSYNWEKKEKIRKPNATKGGIIEELHSFLKENSNFDIKFLQIPKKEGKIAFKVAEKWYSLTLTEHRTKPKEYID